MWWRASVVGQAEMRRECMHCGSKSEEDCAFGILVSYNTIERREWDE